MESFPFYLDSTGQRQFAGGQDDWRSAAQVADQCLEFLQDVDEELVADEPRSCYNCRLRRWTARSFTCMGDGFF